MLQHFVNIPTTAIIISMPQDEETVEINHSMFIITSSNCSSNVANTHELGASKMTTHGTTSLAVSGAYSQQLGCCYSAHDGDMKLHTK